VSEPQPARLNGGLHVQNSNAAPQVVLPGGRTSARDARVAATTWSQVPASAERYGVS